MARALPEFDKECFFITPIGEDGSDTRQRADDVLKAIVDPAAAAVGLKAVRADRIGEGGQVNLQVIEHVCRAATAIADLTSGNLNVYYEIGMRHTTRLPLVLIADESERDKLPFDILTQRTIFFANDMNGVANCQSQVIGQLQAGIDGTIDSPIDAAVNIRAFQQGDAVERTLAELVTSVDGLSREVGRSSDRINPDAIHDAGKALSRLEEIAEERADEQLGELCREFSVPITYLQRRMPTGVTDRMNRMRRARRLAAERALAAEAPTASETAAKPALVPPPRPRKASPRKPAAKAAPKV
jgi:hypothetical protein